jgi:Protein of unknown function (DUF2992)
MATQLTIFFDKQFWVGVIEIEDTESVRSARHVFGPEPSDPEVLAWVRSRSFIELLDRVDSSISVEVDSSLRRAKLPNPKRALRLARRAMTNIGVSSKAEEAMRLEREQNTRERKSKTSAEREAEKERQFALRQERAKDTRRGR